MDIKNIALFQAMGSKMGYLSTRQGVIAQNIANADTPEYRARDLEEVDFGAVLKKVSGSKEIRMERTQAGHIPPGGAMDDPDVRKSRKPYEVAVLSKQRLVKGIGKGE